MISRIFPKVPQSFLGILRVPQEHPFPLNTPPPQEPYKSLHTEPRTPNSDVVSIFHVSMDESLPVLPYHFLQTEKKTSKT